MSITPNQLAAVSGTLSQAAFAGKSFDRFLFISDDIVSQPAAPKPTDYYTLADVSTVFGSLSEEYKAALVWFSNPKVQSTGKPFSIYTYDTVAQPNVVTALNTLWANYTSAYFGGISINILSLQTPLQIAAILSWTLTVRPFIFGINYSGVDAIDAALTTDLRSVSDPLQLQTTCFTYHTSNEYAYIAGFAYMACVDLTGKDTSYTLHWKTLYGVAALDLSNAQAAALKAKGYTFYAYMDTLPMCFHSFTGDKSYLDEIHQSDWVNSKIQENLINLGRRFPKIAQTEDGMTAARNEVIKALELGVYNGTIGRGLQSQVNLGRYSVGDIMTDGYEVISTPVRLQTAADRQARKATLIQFATTLSGAIHSFTAEGVYIR